MRAIVIGGSGFVASHVADALFAAGHDVTIFDIRPSSYVRPGQRFVRGDILDVEAIKRAIDGQDVVYSFAGLADIDEAMTQPVQTVQLNVLGCVHQLEAARCAGVKRFVFASTIYVYSEAGGFYRASKQACELYVEEYQRCFGLDYTILRYGTLYGRRADRRNSVHAYLRQALMERRVTALGTGDEIREYIHVEDAARAAVEILGDAFKNQNIILTGQYPMRLRDLLVMIREVVGPDVAIDVRAPGDTQNISAHYTVTPYTFRPKIGKKLVVQQYLDLGQGLLDCLDEIFSAECGGTAEIAQDVPRRVYMSSVVDKNLKAWSFENTVGFYAGERSRVADLYPSEAAMILPVASRITSVLDIGCAAGNFADIFKEINPAISYTGIDTSSGMVDEARRRHPGVEFRLSTGGALPFGDESFDMVLCTSVLHHNPDYLDMIADMVRVARRFVVVDLPRLVTVPYTFDISHSYMVLKERFPAASQAVEAEATVVPYVLVNAREFMTSFATRLGDRLSGFACNGYCGKTSGSVRLPVEQVIFAVAALVKGVGPVRYHLTLPPDAVPMAEDGLGGLKRVSVSSVDEVVSA